jgi:hypothetical protein
MNIYFSYSTKVSREGEDLDLARKLAEISVKSFKNFYENVYLITDLHGSKVFKGINFTEVYPILENAVKKKYKDVWSLGKLYAIKYIAEKGEKFCHADLDFIITRPLPDDLLDAEVFAQSIEYNLHMLEYNVSYYNLLCKNKYLAQDIYLDRSFNCGILGGKDCSFFYEYADTAIQMVEDAENKKLWLRSYPEFAPWTKAVLAEQYYLACALQKHNIWPKLIFDNSIINYQPRSWLSQAFFEKTGAIHLLGDSKKKIKPVIDKMQKVVESLEKQV